MSSDDPAAPDDDAAEPADAGEAERDRDGDPFHGPAWHPEPPGRATEPVGTASASGDDTEAAGPTRTRRRRTSRRRLRRRRRYGLIMIGIGGLIVLAGVYVLVTAFLARSQLITVRDEVRQLRAEVAAGRLDEARATARQIADHADTAHSYTSGPVWALAGSVPAGGAPFETVRTMTAQVDVLGQRVLPDVVTASRGLEPSSLRRPDGTFDLARLQAVSPSLTAADLSMSRATARVAARPADTWLSPVDSARSELLAQMQSLGKIVQSGAIAARVAPDMLGADGTKRYFVSFQNDAEARGTGGLPGAFGILRADHGRITIERFESDNALNGVSSGLDFGAAYNRLWASSKPYDEYVDSNVSPHFPYAARIWMAMWQRKAHEKLDGALAIDPSALSYLLAVTGPATLKGGTQVSASNVVQLTQQQLYERFPAKTANNQRKQFLLEVARAASTKVLQSSGNVTGLLKAAGRAAAERRLLVYSSSADTEADLARTSLSGALPVATAPFAGLIVDNAGGNKLDYYLDRSMTWTRTGCGATRSVRVTVRLTNAAPAGLNSYVTERNDHPRYPTRPGDNFLAVYYYASAGALRQGTTLDGTAEGVAEGTEQGHPVYGVYFELPRGATRTLVFTFKDPAGKGPVTVLRQPLVRPIKVTVEDQSCG
ncbi:DUF4012 domain-containing protein [uncultured Jatrophihabitans sp.]|uniref:DUF4012 domain-containing protein n=1 Tax=uncultured Jatrophihabitans sp. TaxID=1610747 RepID=UPI0035C97988